MLSDSGRNDALNGLAATVTHVSLHNADPSTTGANELTGGSPAYARLAVSWAAAAAGVRDNSGALDFNVPAGATVLHLGLWTAITAGTFKGWFPVGGFAAQAATFLASTDVFTSYGHGYANGDRIIVADVGLAGVPTGFVEGTLYFVVNTATDTFQLSATLGGASVAGTTDGEVVVQRCLPEVFAAQGVYSVAIGALDLNAQLV